MQGTRAAAAKAATRSVSVSTTEQRRTSAASRAGVICSKKPARSVAQRPGKRHGRCPEPGEHLGQGGRVAHRPGFGGQGQQGVAGQALGQAGHSRRCPLPQAVGIFPAAQGEAEQRPQPHRRAQRRIGERPPSGKPASGGTRSIPQARTKSCVA